MLLAFPRRYILAVVVFFLAMCGITILGISLSGSSGLTTAQAKVIEVTKGLNHADFDFSSTYHSVRLEYEYRGEKYFDSIEGDPALADVNPADTVTVAFDSKHPNAIVKTEAPTKEEGSSGHKVSGWELAIIFILALPVAGIVLFLMMFLHENGSQTSSRNTPTSRVK